MDASLLGSWSHGTGFAVYLFSDYDGFCGVLLKITCSCRMRRKVRFHALICGISLQQKAGIVMIMLVAFMRLSNTGDIGTMVTTP